MELSLNLLPPRLLRQTEEKRWRRQRILMVAAAAIPIVLAYLLLGLRVEVLRSRAASLNRQTAPIRPIAAKVQQMESDLTVLRTREEALRRLSISVGPHWSGILVQLSGLVPPDVWFSSLSVASGQLVIHGQSLSDGAVSTFAARLQSARFLTGASLKFIKAELTGSRRIFTFDITGVLRAGSQTP